MPRNSLEGGATYATEYADQGDDQKGLMAPRPGAPVPASFTQWTDEFSKEEQAARAAAAKNGTPIENYKRLERYKCKNVARCGASFTDPSRRGGHEQRCDGELARRDKLEAEAKAKWEREHPGTPFPDAEPVASAVVPPAEVALISNANAAVITHPEPVVVAFPQNEQYVTKDEVKGIIKSELSGFMAELKGLLGGKKSEEGETRERSESDREAALEDRPESHGGVGPGEGEVSDPPQEPGQA
jgi:hypothetical protein